MLDWCEENYVVLPQIAEFGNTVSSIAFSLMGCVGMYTHSNSGFKKQPMYFQYFIMCIIGICSAFFHSTLWNMGRIMDELSILWLLYHTLFIILQLQLKSGSVFGYSLYCIFILISISLTYFYEIYNSLFMLFEYTPVLIYIFWYWYHNLKRSAFPDTARVFEDSAKMFTIAGGIALVSWNVDRWSECTNTLKNMHLHSVWHLMIAIATYYAIICFQCFYTSYHNCVLITSNIYVISWKKRFLILDVQTKKFSYSKELNDIISTSSSLDSIPEVFIP